MQLSRVEQRRRIKQKTRNKAKLYLFGLVFIMLAGGFFASYPLRVWLAGSLLVTQHHHWAKYTLIGEDKINEMKEAMYNPQTLNSMPGQVKEWAEENKHGEKGQHAQQKELIEITPIERRLSGVHYFKGYAMKVRDPNRVHLVQTSGEKRSGSGKPRGEFIYEFVERTKALAGVNASGFYDPNWMGYGEKPSGLVIQDGNILQSDMGKGETALAITFDGQLITGKYTAKQLVQEMNVRDAVSFKPQLIVDGKNLFKDAESTSWGIAPRTAVGQTSDGSILFIVIDGRQPTHSLGASMTDMAALMEEFGAVNAMAMDGGTSSMMVYRENPEAGGPKILTRASNDDERGRWLPNAWLVY